MSNLKPCPFCDSKAEHYSFNYRKHTVRCSYCLADCGEHDTPERAEFVWNTRPAEDALTAEVERLKKQVADREDEGYAGFVIGVDQMKKKLAEKNKEVERLKEDNQVYRDMLNSLLNEEVYHLDNATITNIKHELDKRGKDTNVPTNAPDTNVGTMEG